MNDLTDLWKIALAFDDCHGERGPDRLATQLSEARRTGKGEEAAKWCQIGALLEQYHRSGSRDRH